MSDSTTIARPYAKAVFSIASETNQLSDWSEILTLLSGILSNADVQAFINNSHVSLSQQTALILAPVEQVLKSDRLATIKNFVSVLAENKRLLVLPEIAVQFEQLRAEHEKTLMVEVTSFSDLTASQQEQLARSLSQRLKREVTLSIQIDKSLLGGAIIRAGDLVINGSVRGKLEKLGVDLAA